MKWFIKRNHLFTLFLCISAGWVLMTVSAEVEQNTRINDPELLPESDRNTTDRDFFASLQKSQPLQSVQRNSEASGKKIIESFYPPLTPGEQAVLQELNAATIAKFPDVPLSEALNTLQKQHGINVFLDGRALREQGLTTEESVNVSLHGVTLKSALDTILRPLGLDYVVDQQVLKITTIEEANRTLKLRIYPIADLGNSPEEFKALENVIRNTCLPPSPIREKYYPVDDLVIGGTANSSRKSVAQYSSRSFSVVPQCQALVVNETDRVHFKITELLKLLRQVRDDQASLRSEVK
ncbi:hypothetical protein [Gimesia maris]|uniref:hypothetical protein n=1 Tax=Gimesia maris TaxID=122 RepID=UPI000E97DC41|nr:hypothetical protein [Gimesia maris]HAW32305.1 hypothetical protein [Planctomycetaceae bacterium]|tara:strand:- start:27423 stop:28307 length:885 start_codon:yes stop_codon:yes gene_type:complete